jgi:hypothetical protein
MADTDNELESSASDVADETPIESTAEPVEAAKSAAELSSPEVVRALAEMVAVANLDLAEHPDAYQRIHAELQSALASIDDA